MNSLNDVIKAFDRIIKKLDNDNFYKEYLITIRKYLLLEHKYTEIVERSGKSIYYYFKYHLPQLNTGYFEYLYNPYNPVRFAVETFRSIEEIRLELEKEK